MSGPANSLNITQPGYVVFDGVSVFTGRTLTAGIGITIANGTGIAGNTTISLAGGGVAVEHLTGNSGGQLNPDGSNNFNTLGTGSITIAGSGSTLTTQLTGLTNHSVQVGAGTATLTQLAVGTNGQVLIGSTAADPVFGTLTSSDSSITFTTGAGTLSLQVAGGATVGKTITGNSGGARPPSSGNWNLLTSNSTVTFIGSGSTLTQNFGLTNLLLGASGTSIAGAVSNAAVGSTSLAALTSGSRNSALGFASLLTNSTGQDNVAVGHNALNLNATNSFSTAVGSFALARSVSDGNTAVGYNTLALLTSNNGCTAVGISALSTTTGANNTGVGAFSGTFITTGANNTLYGFQSAFSLLTGSTNLIIGYAAGTAYTSSESSNLIIGNVGTIAESNVIRIGTQGAGAGQQNTCFIAGIVGVTNTNSQMVSINSSTGQLGVIAATTLIWSVITADQTAVVNNGYICNKASALLLTLPASAVVGDIIRVTGINTALGWKIVQNANQQIFFGTSSTTLGATGFLQSAAIRDSVEIVCVVAGASTVYNVISSVGNITVS